MHYAERADPLEQVAENPRRGTPDERVPDRVGRRLERHSAPNQPPQLEAPQQRGQRELKYFLDLGRLGDPARAVGDQTDEWIDPVAGDERAEWGAARRRSRPARGRGRSPPRSRAGPFRARSSDGKSWRPPGNEISPAWRRMSTRRRVKTACSSPSRSKRGTSTAASTLPSASIAAAASALSRELASCSASVGPTAGYSTFNCSSNMTSPSSVRCTGQRAAICISRSCCSGSRSAGRLTFILKRVGEPRWAGS